MIGTADRVDAWLMLEYRPAWKARAIDDGDLGPDTRRWLDQSLQRLQQAGLKARPQLIRQPEIDRPGITLFVGLPDRSIRFHGDDYRFLQDVDLLDAIRRPERHAQVAEPHYFVCTNGQRDLCCARFGLPLYAALRARVGERAWQVTHLGGHRFAPNVLVLPQGVLYGRVGEPAIDGFLGVVEAGAIAFEQARGRTWLEPAAQAAEILSGRSDLLHVGSEQQDGSIAVRFAPRQAVLAGQADATPLTVRVRQAAEPVLVRKSCGDETSSPVRPFEPG